MRRARNGERGSTMVQTAFVLTALLAIMFGIVDFGRALYTYSYVAQLAREGARWAIVRGSKCSTLNDHCNAQSADVQTYLRSLNEGMMKTSSIAATLQFPSCPAGVVGGSNSPGCIAEVTVTYPFQFVLPFMPKTGNQLMQITMTSTSEMVISQ
jgi:Flp pilus assembly protein TadG